MQFIASTVTDPTKLIALPFAIFHAFSTVAISIFQEITTALTDMAKLFV